MDASKPTIGGAPRHNQNATRHGLRAGRLPKGCAWITQRTGEFRAMLERSVVAAHGSVSPFQATLINSAMRFEERAMLAQRWLRLHSEAMQPVDLLRFSAAITEATDSRDSRIAKLGIDQASQRFNWPAPNEPKD